MDIIPTLIGAIINDPDKLILPNQLDGYNHWNQMQSFGISPRQFMVYNIDDEMVTEIFNVKDKKTSFQVKSGYKNIITLYRLYLR